jgi:3-dehydroquinate synthase
LSSTADSRASDRLAIQSHAGCYEVVFDEDAFALLAAGIEPSHHVIVDERVAELHGAELAAVLTRAPVLSIHASETAKSLDRFTGYVEHLVAQGIRRGHTLVAIGGGIVQDITCFLAATLLRGVPWHFYPTTLLAQADSCIGSKSSINVGILKNILGTFTPPQRVVVSTRVLRTLDERDIRSGIGEMLKVHAIEGPAAFDRIAADYPRILGHADVMRDYIQRSLAIKKVLVELDEFDRGPRNVMNYGHTFGHAIESATSFAIPHGIAVTIGMDMANFVAEALGRTTGHRERMRPVLRANFDGYEQTPVPFDAFMAAIMRDKKHRDTSLTLILPDAEGRIGVVTQPNDDRFQLACREYLESARA